MVYCGNCGSQNPDINRFCLNCGAKLYHSYDEYRDANGQPHQGEIERLGGSPRAESNVPPVYSPPPVTEPLIIPVVNPEPHHEEPSVYQQEPQPAAEQSSYSYREEPPRYDPVQEPPQYSSYQEAPRNTSYQEPPRNASYQEPPRGYPYQSPNSGSQQQQKEPRFKMKFSKPNISFKPSKGFKPAAYMAAAGQMRRPIQYMEGCPNNFIKFRFIGMGISVAAFILILLAMTAVDLSGYGSIFSIGTGERGTMVLVLCILILLVSIVSILIPVFYIVSGITLMGTLLLVLMNSSVYPHIGTTSILLVILLSLVSMLLGVVSSVIMARYVRANARNITLFQSSILAWTGFRLRGGPIQ